MALPFRYAIRNRYSTSHNNHAGFSLIELMVTISILALLVGGGVVAYINFREKQAVVAGVNEIKAYLRTAQTRAAAGDKPSGCDRLQGYVVRALGGDSAVEVTASCDNGEHDNQWYELSPSLSFAEAVEITFWGLYGGVGGAQDITLEGHGYSYQFAVTASGEITVGDWEE